MMQKKKKKKKKKKELTIDINKEMTTSLDEQIKAN
jgi:hypothetical protein